MNKYNDLELSILSCLIQKPELMDKLILEEKHFKKHKRIFKFMESFYEKFKTLDITLMCSICKDKYKMVDYLVLIMDYEPITFLFDEYQKMLIDLYNESEKEKWTIERIYDLSNDLYVRKISVEEFKVKLKRIFDNSDKIFRENEK